MAFCPPRTGLGPDTPRRDFGQATNQGTHQHQPWRRQSHKASTEIKFILYVNCVAKFHYKLKLYLLFDLISPSGDCERNMKICNLIVCGISNSFVLKVTPWGGNVLILITFWQASCQFKNLLFIEGMLNLSRHHGVFVHLVDVIAPKMHDWINVQELTFMKWYLSILGSDP